MTVQKPNDFPQCQKCNRRHVGACLWGSGKCFRCRSASHMLKECPQRVLPTQDRVFTMNAEEANPDTTLFTVLRRRLQRQIRRCLTEKRTMNDIGDEKPTDLSQSWKIVHIPDNPHVSPHLQETVNMFAALIEPKSANVVVRKLNQTAPLENLRHLKRIRKTSLDGGKTQLSVILCIASGDSEPDNMPKDVLEVVNMYQLSTFTVKVCKYAALTKEEWEKQCKLWPTSFHPPTYNIDGITGFSEEDSLLVFNFMKIAISLAKSGIGVVNAAVIVDPSTCQVIASACDQVQSRNAALKFTSKKTSTAEQLEVATMHETTGSENDPLFLVKYSSVEYKLKYDIVSCLNPLGWVEPQFHSSSDSWHPLHHAAIVAIEKSAARDRHLFPLNGLSVDFRSNDHEVPSPTGFPLKRPKTNPNVKDDANMDEHIVGFHCDAVRPYLCTSYDIYFVWEPCIMCAMDHPSKNQKRILCIPESKGGCSGQRSQVARGEKLESPLCCFQSLATGTDL